ncbi:hypothetical protein SAMN05421788_101883 [Filimonas lacunae]|uniref:Peptidase M1 membrane alanine aminopeptidase domain-containing protein n=1 Tax=Filimonas lacunae TaxID=477680 RepID=A0A173MQ33_9BACT|nr:M1 family metallopeptidase [Filimonas lacunae]BAV09448.1 aminopeptidase N-like protein [Filimonas lacunae]SIS73324.1 hypothetical protein SAMN05421788_101883 [Filimonas lacunae]
MLKLLSGCLAAGLLTATVQAQELYKPRNIQNAYNAGTRAANGAPGKKYWQNKGKYDISLTVNPPNKTIYGSENIDYINNSPDTLYSLAIRLICNLHKPQSPRSGYISHDFLSKGVIIDTFYVGNRAINFNNDVGTVANVSLAKALYPKETARLHIAWHYDMSVESGREGMIDSTTFYLAYFYPRISVYDDYNGWDRIEHTDRVEFYSDFNDYEVSIKAPKNFVVWGTGDLVNPGEVLQPEVAKKLAASYLSDEITHMATFQDMQQHRVTQQNDWNTWKMKASHIADVTYGVSDHYVWDASSVVVDSSTKRRSSVQAAYNDTAKDFRYSVANGRYALNWFSHQWPGVPYPFSKMTAFQGYADMEYPMMVNDATTDDVGFSQLVQDHEIAHTYFPFYMGINETRYAFMDEGWATTFEYLIGIAEKGQEKADEFYKQFRVVRYINDPSTEEDQPIISMSSQLSGVGYGNNAYGKPSLAYLALKDMLGDAAFKKALHSYMSRWNGKHPIPWDFFYSINDACGQNLDWFWNSWFFSNNYIDLVLQNVEKKGDSAVLTIQNKGGFPIPFDVVVTYKNAQPLRLHQTPAVWKSNQPQIQITIPATDKIKQVQLDGKLFMDATPQNNNYPVK